MPISTSSSCEAVCPLVIRPALPSDLKDLAARALITRNHGRAFSLQLAGEAWTLVSGETPIAAAGFWPGDGFREAWLMVTPALRVKSVLPAAVRAIGAELQRLYDPKVPTIAAVDQGNRGGQAIARRLGFVEAGEHPMYFGARMFVLVQR
jgi:hypothetical protein